MPPTSQHPSHARRDAGLRRLHAANRTLAVGMVVLMLVFASLAANAFAGHKRQLVPARPESRSVNGRQRARPESGSSVHRRHRAHGRLRPPAEPPAKPSGESTTAGASTGGTATAATTAAPPAPAPTVVSSGS